MSLLGYDLTEVTYGTGIWEMRYIIHYGKNAPFKQTLVITLDNVSKGNNLHYEELNKQIL